MPILDELNERQREAVETTDGPLLVLAGAGTGKTRVITYRVAYLIEKGVPGNAILAVTFTNKAAEVMKERIDALLRTTNDDASGVWVSTFHSFCARLLRREAAAAGLPRDFAIYDDDDQTAAIKRALLVLDLPAEVYAPRSVKSQISHAKNHGITPDEMEADASSARNDERKKVAQLFREYNRALHAAGSV
ncbi:MAG TPA: UvrD-helicase domain-containing protein, partial [Candidatus Acidoferrales bacterium]